MCLAALFEVFGLDFKWSPRVPDGFGVVLPTLTSGIHMVQMVQMAWGHKRNECDWWKFDGCCLRASVDPNFAVIADDRCVSVAKVASTRSPSTTLLTQTKRIRSDCCVFFACSSSVILCPNMVILSQDNQHGILVYLSFLSKAWNKLECNLGRLVSKILKVT